MHLLQRVWHNYSKRKSRKGVIIDFLFLTAVVVVLCAPLRRGLMTYVLRATLIEPDPYDKILYVGSNELHTVRTIGGYDTLITLPPPMPTIINTGSIYEAQTRAELRSLNALAKLYAGRIDVFFFCTDDPDEASAYIQRKRYTSLKLLLPQTTGDEQMTAHDSEGIWAEMMMSHPSTIVVDCHSRVRIKKMGAARWTGSQIEKEIDKIIAEP